VLVTLGALVVVAWVALRLASPPGERERVIMTGREDEMPLRPVEVTLDAETGEMTVIAEDEQGQREEGEVPLEEMTPEGKTPEAVTVETDQPGVEEITVYPTEPTEPGKRKKRPPP